MPYYVREVPRDFGIDDKTARNWARVTLPKPMHLPNPTFGQGLGQHNRTILGWLDQDSARIKNQLRLMKERREERDAERARADAIVAQVRAERVAAEAAETPPRAPEPPVEEAVPCTGPLVRAPAPELPDVSEPDLRDVAAVSDVLAALLEVENTNLKREVSRLKEALQAAKTEIVALRGALRDIDPSLAERNPGTIGDTDPLDARRPSVWLRRPL